MPESYDRLTRPVRIIILFIFERNRGWRGQYRRIIELRYSAAEYVNQITYDEFGVRCSVYILCLQTCIYVYYYAHSELRDNFLCRHNFGFYRRTEEA